MNYNITNKKSENILIVDDHPLIVEGYKQILSNTFEDSDVILNTATSSEEAYYKIVEIDEKSENLKVAFFDINLPPYEEKNIASGVDLALLTRKLFPQCKIVIISMYSDPLWVNQIIKAVNPEGFLAKSDIDVKIFTEFCYLIQVQGDFFYYSDSIKKSNQIIIQKNINWDEHDTKILQLISSGVKTVHLTNFIPLSLSAIEKRKANIKKHLIFDSGSDKELIKRAKSIGLIK